VSWNALKPREKALVRYLLLAVVAGLLLMSIRSLGAPQAAAAATTATSPVTGKGALASEEATIDADLAGILGQVAGAGAVHVRVALRSTDQNVYAVDHTTNTTTTQGSATGEATTTQNQASEQTVTVNNAALPVDVQGAQVQSVLVVATGATDPAVAAALARATAAALGVPLYEVVVLTGEGSK